MDDDVFKFLNYSWAFTERKSGRRVVLDSVYGSHLTCRNLDTFHSACNKLKYFKGNKHNIIKRFLSHKMSKGAGNTSPLSAFRLLSFYYVFFKSKEKYEAKTSVMADLFTLTYTPLPTPSREHTQYRGQILSP